MPSLLLSLCLFSILLIGFDISFFLCISQLCFIEQKSLLSLSYFSFIKEHLNDPLFHIAGSQLNTFSSKHQHLPFSKAIFLIVRVTQRRAMPPRLGDLSLILTSEIKSSSVASKGRFFYAIYCSVVLKPSSPSSTIQTYEFFELCFLIPIYQRL